MAAFASWLERISPFRGFGNAGAVASAGRACQQRRQAEAATEARLRMIAARLGPASRPVRRSA